MSAGTGGNRARYPSPSAGGARDPKRNQTPPALTVAQSEPFKIMHPTTLIGQLKSRHPLQKFQETFIRGAFAKDTELAALSLPRGNGKSSLLGWILANSLTPGGSLFDPSRECILAAASFAQARIVFGVVREVLADGRRNIPSMNPQHKWPSATSHPGRGSV